MTSDEQLTDALNFLSNAIDNINEATAYVQHACDVLRVMNPGGAVPEHVLFASPVTGKVGDVFGGDWFIATNYAEYYTATGRGAYHTGVDLNRPGFADSGAPVYAVADGDVVISRIIPGWQGVMVVIKHVLEDGSMLWTRYAHLKNTIQIGQTVVHVKRGDVIGYIGDYTPVNDPRGDHVHYDVSWVDLGQHPDDWPSTIKDRVLTDYIDPVKWHKERSQ